MTKPFLELFEVTEQLKNALAKRDRLQEERQLLTEHATSFIDEVIDKYYQEQKKIDDLIKQAEKENQEKETEIIELTKQLVKGGMEQHAASLRLEKLKADVNAAPLQIKAYEQLRNDVCMSYEDQQKLSYYHDEGVRVGQQIYSNAVDIQEKILLIKEGALMCAASIDLYFESRKKEFLPERYRKIESMKKEEVEE